MALALPSQFTISDGSFETLCANLVYVAQKGAMAGNPLSRARRQLSAWQSSDVTNETAVAIGLMGGGVTVEVKSTVVV